MKNKFTIHVNGNEYQVTPVPDSSVNDKEFKIETKCDYLFTISENDNYWSIVDRNVEPLDDLLIQQIGFEIETNGAMEK
jgi:hypothetical protein